MATRKVTAHLTQNEGLIFEKSAPGKKAYRLAPLDVPEVDPSVLLGEAQRSLNAELPELSEIEIIRHFTRLSTWNYAIDLGMYPLGSCTMKYNPRVNEFVSRLEGIAEAHPYQPEELSQGCAGDSSAAAEVPAGDYGDGGDYAAAGGGGAWRVHGDPAGAGVSRVQRESAEEGDHSGLGARDQSGDGGDLRV